MERTANQFVHAGGGRVGAGLYDAIFTGYHKVHLVAKQKDLIVQTRDGNYSGN